MVDEEGQVVKRYTDKVAGCVIGVQASAEQTELLYLGDLSAWRYGFARMDKNQFSLHVTVRIFSD